MATLERRQYLTRLPDLLDWTELPRAAMLPFAPGHAFRVEDYAEDGRYVVRAELPGLDPARDIEITATYKQGILGVSVPVTEAKTQARKVEITTAS